MPARTVRFMIVVAASVAALHATLAARSVPDQVAPPAAQRPHAEQRAVVLYSTRGDNRLHILDASNLELVSSHDLGIGAHELIASHDGRWAIGTAYGGPGPGHQPTDKRLAVFDLRARALHRTIELEDAKRPNDAAFTPDGVHAYVTVEQPPRVVRVNVETGEYKSIALSTPANHMLTLSPDAKRLYVAHVMPGRLTVIDTTTDEVIGTHGVPDGAEGLAVTPDNTKVWVSCNRSNAVVIVDAQTGAVERRLSVEGFPFRLRMAPDGKTVAVSCPKSDEIALFEVSDPERVRRVPLSDPEVRTAPGAAATSLAYTPDGARVAVLRAGPRSEVVLVDVAAAQVVARRPADGPIADALTTSRIAPPA